MRDIFPGYTLVPVPADDASAKWYKATLYDVNLGLGSISVNDLENFNAKINLQVKYRTDLDDHWQTPMETWQLKSGDCEDFAILKWSGLKTAGVSPASMALILGEIAALSGNQPHAFLVVELEGRQWVMDNKFDQLIAPRDYINWQPKKAIIGSNVFLFSKQFTISEQASHG